MISTPPWQIRTDLWALMHEFIAMARTTYVASSVTLSFRPTDGTASIRSIHASSSKIVLRRSRYIDDRKQNKGYVDLRRSSSIQASSFDISDSGNLRLMIILINLMGGCYGYFH